MTLDSKYCGRTLREWASMTEAQRLADPQVGEKRLKALNARLAEALAVQGTSDASPAPQPRPESPAIAAVDVQTDQTTVVTQAAATREPVAETPAIPPAEASKPAPPVKPVTAPPEPPQSLKLEDVFKAAEGVTATGYKTRNPSPRLSAGQAELQARLFKVLSARGMKLNNQGDVYGWLLDEAAAAVLGAGSGREPSGSAMQRMRRRPCMSE